MDQCRHYSNGIGGAPWNSLYRTIEGHYNNATELAKGLSEMLLLIQERIETKKKKALAISSDIKALEQEYQAKLAPLQDEYENAVEQLEFCEANKKAINDSLNLARKHLYDIKTCYSEGHNLVHGKSWLERCDRRGEDPFDVFKQTFSPPGGDLSSKTLSSMPLSDGKIVGRAMHNYRLSKTAGYKEKWPLATAKASVVANLGHHGRKLLLRIAAQLNQGSVESLVTQEWPASDVIAICKELDPQESVYRCEEYFGSGGSNTPSNANRRSWIGGSV
jgi:hypothetical protein